MPEQSPPLLDFDAEAEFVAARSGHDEATVLALFRRLRGGAAGLRGGDSDSLRDHLVMVHAPLVEHCARGFLSSGEPLDDLVQEGYVGLIKAVDRFDPNKGIKFSTYACHLISGEIRHYLRDLGRLIHEPGWHFELRGKIGRATESLTASLGRVPTPEEIANHLSVKADTVRDVLGRAQTLHVESLDVAPGSEEGSERLTALERHESQVGGPRRGEEGRVEDQLFLEAALPQLRELEQKALRLFFYDEFNKSEVARELGISVNYASYLLRRATESLKRILENTASPVLPHSFESELSQGQARAAYLLELARAGANPDPRRAFRLETRVPALTRPSVVNLGQFSNWIDEEVARCGRYNGFFSTLWLQLRNWKGATEHLDDAGRRTAGVAASTLVRRSCRTVDRVAAFSAGDPPGLHFLVLLPATGAPGRSLGERLHKAFSTCDLPGIRVAFHVRWAFATFPEHGRTTDELFAFLGARLGEAE